MNGIIHFETFLITGILLNITPGNDTIFILSKSIAQGKKAGVFSVLGIATGSILHTLLAAFGLSILIQQSPLLFNAIKYAGAVYLLYLAYTMLTDKSKLNMYLRSSDYKTNYFGIYRDGMITNILNPKVALFFIAFLPQFIAPNVKDSLLPFLLLGATFITTGTIWCLLLALFSATIFAKLKNHKNVASYINKICGLSLVALSIKVALSK